ncbi:MAG: virion core protein [Ruminococcaceae bacterium]|nr:virion core protein [Oscillospiraceae bacterium]
MGIIKAFFGAVGGSLADQWEEVIEAGYMSDTTVFTKGVKVRKNDKRSSNKKATEDVISNGSIIHVYDNQFMLLVDGGKVVDFTAEPGYYKVDNSSAPSLFCGQLGDTLKDTFSRIKYGGVPSYKQQVFYINLQEIKGIKFGTRSPVNYFDNFYNSELFLRAHGTYSIKITDPIKFYAEAIPRSATNVDINDINEQYLSEFLSAFQAAMNKMSADNIRISHVASKSVELSKYMATELDEDWKNMRGFEVLAVGVASISYDDESKKLINMRNQGAMLGDPSVREGYVQGAVARGMEAAGSNANGSAAAFMGMGIGMNAGGSFMGAASASNREQMERQAAGKPASAAGSWTCACGTVNTGKFCTECGSKKPEANGSWTCTCGAVNTGKFCTECGAKKPESSGWFCPECGKKNEGKFCTECGAKKA